MHGEKDKVVPISQSVLLADALSEKGVEVELVRKPEWGHYHGRGVDFDPDCVFQGRSSVNFDCQILIL